MEIENILCVDNRHAAPRSAVLGHTFKSRRLRPSCSCAFHDSLTHSTRTGLEHCTKRTHDQFTWFASGSTCPTTSWHFAAVGY